MIAWAAAENGAVVGGERPDLVVPWWSFTKTVIAAAALALVRDGRLSLDDPLPGRSFTLRQLLQHRAGLCDYGELRAYQEAVARDEEPWSAMRLLEEARAERLRYRPGEGWTYSNIGYLFAAQAVEAAGGEDLGEALRRLVFAPLGVTEVRLARTRADLGGVALGQVRSYHPGWVYHGLLVGTLRDAALLLDGLLGGRLLPPDLLRAMRGRHPLGGKVPGRPWAAPGYGLGLMSGLSRFGWMVEGHTGGGPGSACAVYRCDNGGRARVTAAFSPDGSARLVETMAFGRILRRGI
jgi:CubicO group peptidase (beta-lactamase class C family)